MATHLNSVASGAVALAGDGGGVAAAAGLSLLHRRFTVGTTFFSIWIMTKTSSKPIPTFLCGAGGSLL